MGGGHENERRAGTENLAAVAGLTTAMELFLQTPVFPAADLTLLTTKLASCLAAIPGVTLLAADSPRLPNTLSYVVEGTDSFALLAGLDVEGICASAGAACSAGSLEPSHVVSAMGYPPALARSLVRFSLGRGNSLAEVESVCAILPALVSRAQAPG